MKILHIRPRCGSEGKTIAEFDLEFSELCRLYRLRLVEQPNGRRLTYGPMSGGARTVTFAGELADQITALASAALAGGVNARVQSR